MPSTAPIEATPAQSLSAAASIMPSSAGSGSYMSSSVGYEGSGNPSDYYYDYWGSYWGTYDWYDYYYNTSGSGSYYGDYTDSYLGNYYSGYSENYNIEYGISGYMRDQLFSPKDQWDERISQFQAEFKNETTDSRHDMGHSVKDMVVSASFASSLQNVSKFEALTTTQYGNCYTMSSPKYIAMRSGPAHGLKLTLNLEMDEYIKNFASGYGIRMVFHEPGTFPLPADEGMTLSPGFETSIGLRMVKVTRLGPPHGHCSDGVEFYERYKVRYSVTVCMMFCRIMKTIEKCECIPSDSPDLNFTSNKVDICHSKKNRACQLAVDLSFDDGSAVEKCNCVSPCKEVVYTKTMSGRRWPNDDYLENVLMGDICSRNISSMTKACGEKANNTFDPNTYRYNFLRVLIYFEDLNYERIDQTPLYESVRFLSDIGGAMGLFLGASLLSFVEILQLVLEMVLYLFRSRHPTTNVEHISQKEKTLNSKRDSLYPVPEKIKTSFFGESIRKSNPDPHAVNS